MKTQFLDSTKIDQAYGLVRLAAPRITLEAWRDFALSLISHSGALESGILTIEDERGYITGLAGYAVDRDLEHGRTLVVKNFMAIESLEAQRKEIAFALIWAVQDLARENQCRAIRTILHEPEAALRDAWIVEVLKGAGHHTEARRFIKAVESTG